MGYDKMEPDLVFIVDTHARQAAHISEVAMVYDKEYEKAVQDLAKWNAVINTNFVVSFLQIASSVIYIYYPHWYLYYPAQAVVGMQVIFVYLPWYRWSRINLPIIKKYQEEIELERKALEKKQDQLFAEGEFNYLRSQMITQRLGKKEKDGSD